PAALSLTYTLSLHDALPIFLEGRCGKEGVCRKGCLRDTKHYLLALCRLFALCLHLLVYFLKLQNIYQSTRQEVCITVVLHTDLLDRKSTRLNSSHVSISYAV